MPVLCGIVLVRSELTQGQGVTPSTSSAVAAARRITGVAEEVAGDWSNGQVVSPKAELDMGSRQRTRDGTVQ